MTDTPKVTPADREAAAKALGYGNYGDASDYRNNGSEDRRLAFMVQAFARHAAQARIAALEDHGRTIEAAEFLLDRIEELTWEGTWRDFQNEWHGHVEPALSRLRTAIRALKEVSDHG